MDAKEKRQAPAWFFMTIIVILACLAIAGPIWGAATLNMNYVGGINTWNWDAKEIYGTFAGGSDTYVVPSDFDVDMVTSSYDDQASATLQLTWSISNYTVKIYGDDGEAFHSILWDFPGE